MKFTTTLVALAAVATQAAAVREHGQHDTSAIFKSGVGHCGTPGNPCHALKRSAEAVANALAEADASPKKAQGGKIYFCSVPGSACNEKRQLAENIGRAAENALNGIYAREAEAEAEAEAEPKVKGGKIYFCSVPGSACNEKRDASPEAKKKAKAKGGKIYFCSVPGSACMEKRNAEAEAEALADPEAEPKKAKGGKIYFCSVPGSACNEKRDASPEPKKKKAKATGGKIYFCSVPGSACMEKRETVDNILKQIKEVSPNVEKAECHEEGQPCNLITEAHRAFAQVKARSAEASKVTDPKAKLAYCHGEDCSTIAQAHLKAAAANHPHARSAEAECDGEDGACTLAARAMGELEGAINEGMASLEEF